MLRASFIAGCICLVFLATACTSKPPEPAADHSIVAGERIGAVKLGMSREEVTKILGAASGTAGPRSADHPCDAVDDTLDWSYTADVHGQPREWLRVAFPGGRCSADQERVTLIAVYTDSYYTPEGLSAGATDDAITEKLGKPDCLYHDEFETDLLYKHGLMHNRNKAHPEGFFVVFDPQHWDSVIKQVKCP